MKKPNKCEICDRTDTYLNFHHLIPKFVHGKNKFAKEYEKDYMKEHGIWICKYHCHKTLHTFYNEKYLAEFLNTKDKILSDEKMIKYIEWHKKQQRVK